ncbi:GATA zinc finger domain containing 2Ab isoform X2 [Syngnathus acus]|uniref:GATA zinc finger domain containing 2Ab isoform X2 n=1 Tax=Syngnathus acus TaxID=161584 RepID=UPI0018863932|nr:GATA zinc finger domain containing 2Ab isoform X2 [Syngnathus acus]
MSEEAVRQTRSQKRAMEKDSTGDVDSKRVKMEKGDAEGSPSDLDRAEAEGDTLKSEPSTKLAASILKSGEVNATIKVEVQTGDEPVDMSTSKSDIKRERQPPSPDDVIVLSDNEPSSPLMNGHCFSKTDTEKLMKSSPEEREQIIKQLKEELRLQEAKLVLLKKLRQSQIQKESTAQKVSGSVATPPPLVRGSKGPLQVTGRSSGTVIPPPLVRGGQHVPSKHGSQTAMPPLVRGAQQIASLRQQQQQHGGGSGPPPLLLAPRASVPNVQVQGQRIIQQGLIRVANVANSNILVNIPQASPTGMKGSSASPNSGINDSPASRQAAAKLALRKQLEKTLLEIPPPKPPAPEFNFLPSAANNEFIYLLGLEEVVQKLLDMLGRGNLGPAAGMSSSISKEPYTCTQCKTDFTSRWRKEKAGSILCNQCMSSNQKKALKAEHTSRLKAAFVKALQQEQEIEQRILQQATTSSATPVSKTTSSSPSMSKSEVLMSHQYKQVRAAMPHRSVTGHHSAIKQVSTVWRTSAFVVSPHFAAACSPRRHSSQLQSAVTAAALSSRPSKHGASARSLQQGMKVSAGGSNSNQGNVTAWRKSSGNAGVTMGYVNPSLSAHKTTSSVERQREYLLDMIPSRSISHAANTWK